jgi:hypothetical protein
MTREEPLVALSQIGLIVSLRFGAAFADYFIDLADNYAGAQIIQVR